MKTLKFNKPQLLNDCFDIKDDTTIWGGDYISVCNNREKTPLRDRASFGCFNKLLDLKIGSNYVKKESNGLYLMAFDFPSPALYVGIAAGDSKNPEGVIRRIAKHCVKARGSNVGSINNSGGVNHTGNWREFAVKRYNLMNEAVDDLSDVRFNFAETNDNNKKSTLELFEGLIFHNLNEIRYDICRLFWPEFPPEEVFLLTSRASNKITRDGINAILW